MSFKQRERMRLRDIELDKDNELMNMLFQSKNYETRIRNINVGSPTIERDDVDFTIRFDIVGDVVVEGIERHTFEEVLNTHKIDGEVIFKSCVSDRIIKICEAFGSTTFYKKNTNTTRDEWNGTNLTVDEMLGKWVRV